MKYNVSAIDVFNSIIEKKKETPNVLKLSEGDKCEHFKKLYNDCIQNHLNGVKDCDVLLKNMNKFCLSEK
jgi:hypothetical protein